MLLRNLGGACLLLLTAAMSLAGADSGQAPQTPVAQAAAPAADKPLIVIYTLSDCPHCREAKEFLTANKIPYVNREVDTDDEQMAALLKIYDAMGVPEEKRGVPLFVIGNRIRIQGFDREKVLKALKEAKTPKK